MIKRKTEKIYYKIMKFITILYVKWIKGQCRHLCMFCQYRNMCEDNFEL